MDEHSGGMTQERQAAPEAPAEREDGGERLFTQVEVNRIVSDRLARERARAEAPREDPRERALREREEAFAARESRRRCEWYLEDINMQAARREDFLETLDTSDFEGFKAAVDRLGGAYLVRKVGQGNVNIPAPAAVDNSRSLEEGLKAAFQSRVRN